eukprot:9682594-Alexandrium_andersonii.AAC.1
MLWLAPGHVAAWARHPVSDTGACGCAGAPTCRSQVWSAPGPEVHVRARPDDAPEARTARGPFETEEGASGGARAGEG